MTITIAIGRRFRRTAHSVSHPLLVLLVFRKIACVRACNAMYEHRFDVFFTLPLHLISPDLTSILPLRMHLFTVLRGSYTRALHCLFSYIIDIWLVYFILNPSPFLYNHPVDRSRDCVSHTFLHTHPLCTISGSTINRSVSLL